MREKPFTRPTIVAANELLAQAARTHTDINKLVLRLGLEAEIPDDNSLGIEKEKKVDRLGRIVLARAEDVVATVDGSFTLAEAFIREVLAFALEGSGGPRQDAFLRGLSRDGYVIVLGDGGHPPSLRIALPVEVDLPEADDEVRNLLKHFQFNVAAGHLEQAIEAHTRGEWAAANAQLRTFLEGLLDDIARYVDSARANALSTSENRRAMLAEPTIGFLAVDRNEWTPDGKNYINGLFKMLHTDGSHPGLSDEDHCTFRLHIALVTARTFLRRLWAGHPTSPRVKRGASTVRHFLAPILCRLHHGDSRETISHTNAGAGSRVRASLESVPSGILKLNAGSNSQGRMHDQSRLRMASVGAAYSCTRHHPEQPVRCDRPMDVLSFDA